jgi:hypothetical protein
MTNALAVGYDWCFDALSADERRTVRTAIVEKGLKPGLKVYDSKNGWHKRTNNWNQVCNGGMVVGALAVAEDEPDLARTILTHARASLPIAMNEFAPDGGIIEGPGYWGYATMYVGFCLAAARTAISDDLGLLASPGLAKTGMFRIHTIGPLDRTFNFADAGDGAAPAAQMFYFARVFETPGYAAHEREVIGERKHAPDPFHLMWFTGGGSPRGHAVLPTAAYFRHVEVALMRSAWNDRNAAFVGFKGGDNGASHANLDLGDFVYDVDGVRWATELGPDDYNLPGYFGAKRWTYYRMRTEGQNTLTIDGENQAIKAKAKIVEFSAEKKQAVADLTAAYPKAKHVTRAVQLMGRQLMIADDVQTDAPVEVVWHMHTTAAIKVDGSRATLTSGGKKLTARILGPSNARFDIAPADPEPAEKPNPPIRHGARLKEKLTVRLPEKVKDLQLVVLLAPEGEAPAAERPTFSDRPHVNRQPVLVPTTRPK